MNQIYFDRLVDEVNKSGYGAFLLEPSEELHFIAGFSPYICERFQGLFIKKTGECFYFCNMLTKDEVEDHLPPGNIYAWYDRENFTEILQGVLEKEGLIGTTIAVNTSARAFNLLDIQAAMDVKFVNGKTLLENIRIIKTLEEMDWVKESARRADIVMGEIIKYIRPGITEGQIAGKIRELFSEQEMETEFTIVASGPNAALPHYSGVNRIIQAKDIVLLDLGGKYNGLCSDISRTVFVGGVTEEERKAYQIVLRSLEEGVSAVSAGVMSKTVDFAARTVINENGYNENFVTRVGHGIGYSVHEAPYINGNNELILKDGMAFSIEPGIYIKNHFGIRIEDIVLIENGQGKPINNFTRELIVLSDFR